MPIAVIPCTVPAWILDITTWAQQSSGGTSTAEGMVLSQLGAGGAVPHVCDMEGTPGTGLFAAKSSWIFMDTQEKQSKMGVPGSDWLRLLLKAGTDLNETHSGATADIKFGPKKRQKKGKRVDPAVTGGAC